MSEHKGQRRRWGRLSAEQWREHVEEQARSGQSVARYCRERGLSAATFRNRKARGAEPALRTLSLVGGAGVLEVELGGGKVIRVMPGCPEGWVERVLEMAR